MLLGMFKFQHRWMAHWPPSCHRRHVHAVHPGHALPVGVTLPPSAPRHPSPEEPEAEDQEQGQGQEQNPGRPAAVRRLCHLEEQDHQDPALLHRDRFPRAQPSSF